jgi:signal transduction histidine kinase
MLHSGAVTSGSRRPTAGSNGLSPPSQRSRPQGDSEHSRATIIVRGIAIASLLIGAGALVLLCLNRSAYSGPDLLERAPQIFSGLAYVVVGYVVVSRQPGNRLCWILIAIGVIQLLSGLTTQWGIQALITAPGSLPAGTVMAWIGQWSFQLVISGWALAALLFPNGDLPSRLWRPVIWLVCTAALLTAAGTASLRYITPLGGYEGAPGPRFSNPFAIPQGAAISGIGVVIAAAALVVIAASIIIRFRRAVGDEREQMKWLAFVMVVDGLIWAAILPMGLATGGNSGIMRPMFGLAIQFLAYGLLASIAIAILKYRLYDIDIVISRTLVYGSLAAFITAVYVGIVVGVGTLIGSGGQPNLALSIVATAIVAVAFQPVRERLQTFANRLVYGKRATPYEVLSQFSERVAESYAADDVLPRMARVLAEGTGAERAEVWLRSSDHLQATAEWPDRNGDEARSAVVVTEQLMPALPEVDRAVPVRHQGVLLGALTVTKRPGESLTPVELRLLGDLAGQAGLVLKNVGLTTELLQRVEDLRASRQRLVAAQDEERRRLERNLHDGAQQNLVALKVKLGLAEAFAEKDPARTRELVGQLKSDADEALETLRDLGRGIYPPLLADRGLPAALEAQARKATLPVELVAEGIGRYPQDAEAAIYFCVLEALQNVQKYADASRAQVRLVQSDGFLSVAVEDDGKGFDPMSAKKGSGLQNMEDRLEALGGSVEIESAPGSGATVTVRLPIGEAVRA